MLSVSTVYVYWRRGDMVDAYLTHARKRYQVLMVEYLGDECYRVTFLTRKNKTMQFWVYRDFMLEIREDVEGIAA